MTWLERMSSVLRIACAGPLKIFAACRRKWQDRIDGERLMALDDHLLHDIGLTREQAQRMAERWLWQ